MTLWNNSKTNVQHTLATALRYNKLRFVILTSWAKMPLMMLKMTNMNLKRDDFVIISAITGVVHCTRDGNLIKPDLNTYLK